MNLEIVAIQESFIDYPEHLSLIVFFKNCPWNCVNCQNIINLKDADSMDIDEVKSYLEQSKGLFNHIVLSGGEPTYYDDLPEFVLFLKSMGFKVKLDTNGCRPSVIAKVLPYIDAVSMDIKNSVNISDYEKYIKTARCDFIDVSNVIDSIKLLKEFSSTGKFVEFRTTLLDDTINCKEVMDSLKYAIGELGSIRYTVNDTIITSN